jgi:DNA-binding transcriptional LysR family regulator
MMIVRRHCELLSDTSRYFTARGVRPFFPARVTSDDRALRLVRAGLGVTVMPDCFRAPGVVRPRLADFPFTATSACSSRRTSAAAAGRATGDPPAAELIVRQPIGFMRHPV